MLIYQGDALERQAALTEDEQKQVYADYQRINQTPGVSNVPPMGLPQNATTVRVDEGKTLITDGPCIGSHARAGLPGGMARLITSAASGSSRTSSAC